MITVLLFLFYRNGNIINEKNIRVYLGKMRQHEKNKNEVFRTVQKIYTHNSYNYRTKDNDIALLHLSSPVKFKNFLGFKNKHIQPVSLLGQGRDFPPNTKSMIIGWGTVEFGGKKRSCQ